ncbi:hypothetical protein [Ekhidna sp.]|uniref:hypothetical protein n=1 Tax=Ekhidna sp. TaxID=2608089 RepID=UPI003B5A86BF
MGITILGLVIITLAILPFVGMHISRKKVEKELISGLRTMAESCNSQLASRDFGVEFAIGISSSKRYLFFYKQRNGLLTKHCVALYDIQKCTVNCVKRNIQSSETIIDKLELVLIPYAPQKSPIVFDFFSSAEHFRPNGELPLVKKWEAIVKDALHHKTVFPIAS